MAIFRGRKTRMVIGLLLAALVIAPFAWAQLADYELMGGTIGSAAGTMSGGDFVVDAGLGGSLVGGAAHSEDYVASGGVWPGAPLACQSVVITALTSDSPAVQGEAVNFEATVGGTRPCTYTWDFGGSGRGTGTDGPSPAWTYDAVGRYKTTLTAQNACGRDEETLMVNVRGDLHHCYLPLVARRDGD